MKSKPKNGAPIRVFGQRSIPSTFRFVPFSNPSDKSFILVAIASSSSSSNHSESQENVTNQASKKNAQTTHLSLSHFLDRKLQKSSQLPHTVPGKSTPFQSPLGLSAPRVEQAGTVKQVEEEKNSGSDKLIFEKFKQTDEEKRDLVILLDVDDLENSVAEDIQESRKRKNPFEVSGNENQTVKKHVVVLGGESKLKQKGYAENDSINKKPRHLYNHYANGRGWWNDDMEGVDNEELGFSEVWEGVGSTTLGGIVDWH
ncbi:hypothetical protein RIF29_21367 [Crotalaria pallida]|uniref:Uncharacterized protein n=1 Tax=Crotalaria pallida TaxID=3830 RepID=A0AAN9F2W2_CROPI